MAIDELGIAPERAIYVGNRHDGDVVGPHRAGVQTAWVPMGYPSTVPDPAPTYRLSSMHEITDVL
ncbi:hypothetical protein G9C84_08495 [Halolamina sp. R1-12]|nr:hypothetical protein [Halolamina sp. R1-12]